MKTNAYPWRFFKSARLVQVLIENSDDLAHLRDLDQKFWTVLSAPTVGVRFDARTLELLDADHDGRVRAPEVLAAVEWLAPRLASLDILFEPWTGTLPLAAINAATPEGQKLAAALKRIAAQNGRQDAADVTLKDVTETEKEFAGTRFNGDGVVCADAAENDATKAVIAAIGKCFGTLPDRSGGTGINQEKADAFFKDAAAYTAWRDAAKTDPAILFLGDKTHAAAQAFAAVATKVDDYFTRCRMAAFDSRAATALNRSDDAIAALADKTLNDRIPALAAFPLAAVGPDRDLPLDVGVNPYWATAVADFAKDCVAPTLGVARAAVLSAAQWDALKAKFAAYQAWLVQKAGGAVEAVGADTLAEMLRGGQAQAAVDALLQQDLALADEHEQLVDAERVMRYAAHLAEYVQNYVNQARLYNPESWAISQTGTLYLDARSCQLCFHVTDVDAHAALAEKSKCCLLYLKLTRPSGAETRTICCVVTAGFARTLWVGRNGLFYDRDGKDWDAVVVKKVDAAVSLQEAFWAPWIKLSEFVSAQIHKFLSTKQDGTLAAASAAATTLPAKLADGAAPSAANASAGGAAMASSVAALGIGIGMMGAAFAGLIGLVAGLPMWKVAVGVVCVVLVVSLPSVIITWFKLRVRDLGAILNASGWAVNRPLRFSIGLARRFTKLAVLPPAAHAARDPYEERHPVLDVLLWIFLAAAIALLIATYI